MLALDPNQTFTAVLDNDMPLEPNARPQFIFRYLTARQFFKVAATIQSSSETDPTVIGDAIRAGLKSTLNVPQGELEDLLTVGELGELLQKMLSANVPSADEKKV